VHAVLGVQRVALEVEEHVTRVGCRDRVERTGVEDLEARLLGLLRPVGALPSGVL